MSVGFGLLKHVKAWPVPQPKTPREGNVFCQRKRGSFDFTTLFTNMRILKFKSQLTIAFFAAVNHLNGPLRKQNFTLTGSKGHGF